MPDFVSSTIEELREEFAEDLDHPAVLAASAMRQSNVGELIDDAAVVQCASENLKYLDDLLKGVFD